MFSTRLAPWVFPVLFPALLVVATCAAPVRGEPPLDIYLQLVETDTDTFAPELAPARPYIPQPPFEFKNGKLTAEPGIFTMNKTVLAAKFIPFSNELPANTPNATRFFLALRRDYGGTGRIGFHAEYFAFTALPFNLPRPAWSALAGTGGLTVMRDVPGAKPEPVVVYPESVSEIYLNPTDSITAAEEARLWAGDLTILSSNSTGGVLLAYGGKEMLLAPGEERTLSAMNKTVNVSRWNFDNTRSQYGTVTFSTVLRIINRGPVDVAGLPRKQ